MKPSAQRTPERDTSPHAPAQLGLQRQRSAPPSGPGLEPASGSTRERHSRSQPAARHAERQVRNDTQAGSASQRESAVTHGLLGSRADAAARARRRREAPRRTLARDRAARRASPGERVRERLPRRRAQRAQRTPPPSSGRRRTDFSRPATRTRTRATGTRASKRSPRRSRRFPILPTTDLVRRVAGLAGTLMRLSRKSKRDATFARKLAEALSGFGPRRALLGPRRGAGECGVAAQGRHNGRSCSRTSASSVTGAAVEGLRSQMSSRGDGSKWRPGIASTSCANAM
jgi:hypothetical protein